MNEYIIYKRLQLFLSVGILSGIWGNLFIHSKNLNLKSNNK